MPPSGSRAAASSRIWALRRPPCTPPGNSPASTTPIPRAALNFSVQTAYLASSSPQPVSGFTPHMIDDLLSLAGEAVSHATKLGADAVHAVAADGRSTEISILDGKIEKVEQSEARDISLKVYAGKSSASISGSVLTREAIHRLAENALTWQGSPRPIPMPGVAEPEQLASDIPDLDLAAVTSPTRSGLEALARRAEAAGLAVRGVTKSSGAGASARKPPSASSSPTASRRATGAPASASPCRPSRAKARHGARLRLSSAVHFADLRDPETIGRSAGERAAKRLNPRKVKSQSVPVIFDRRVAWASSATCWAPSMARPSRGAPASSRTSWASRSSAPTSPSSKTPSSGAALARAPSTARGWPATGRNLIDQGVLTGWILDLRSARQLGLSPTGQGSRGGPSTSNVYLPGGRAVAGGADQGHLPGALCHRTHRLLHQHGDGRLQPRRLRLLDRERRTHLPGERDHHRRKPQGHVQDHGPRDNLEFRSAVNAPNCLVEGLTIAGL